MWKKDDGFEERESRGGLIVTYQILWSLGLKVVLVEVQLDDDLCC